MSNSNEYTELIAGYHVSRQDYQEWVYVLREPLRLARQRLVELRGDRIDLIFLAVAHIGRDALLQLIDNLLSLIFSRHDCSINTFLLWD